MQTQSLKTEAKEVLVQLVNSINQLTLDEYTEKIALLSNASIGEHTRHIIELFQQLFSGYALGKINYDDRKRDIRLQEDIDFATEKIASIIEGLEKADKKLIMVSLYSNQEAAIESSYTRELMYNTEHCVHHQAIIKIALLYLNKNEIDLNFGVAKSTIEFRKLCAQ